MKNCQLALLQFSILFGFERIFVLADHNMLICQSRELFSLEMFGLPSTEPGANSTI